MVSEKMVAWGSQGCVIRDLAAYGEQRAAVVGAENVFKIPVTVAEPDEQGVKKAFVTHSSRQGGLHVYTR